MFGYSILPSNPTIGRNTTSRISLSHAQGFTTLRLYARWDWLREWWLYLEVGDKLRGRAIINLVILQLSTISGGWGDIEMVCGIGPSLPSIKPMSLYPDISTWLPSMGRTCWLLAGEPIYLRRLPALSKSTVPRLQSGINLRQCVDTDMLSLQSIRNCISMGVSSQNLPVLPSKLWWA